MKALVFDLDDTLWNSSKEIGPRTRKALDAWLASGREICLATSRPIRMVRKFLPPELFQCCEIVTMNGVVQHSRGEVSFKANGIGEAARAIVTRFPAGSDLPVTLEVEGEHFSANVAWTDDELMSRNAATRELFIELDRLEYPAVRKVAINGQTQRIAHLLPWLEALGVDALLCSDATFINVVARGVDKSTTLARHFALKRWQRDEIAVFGDDWTDIAMMRLATHAIAVSNARPEVKAVATEVIAHCNDDGIGDYLQLWLR